MNAWSHLPNAKHIDRILASLESDPAAWRAAWDAARDAAWDAAWGEARRAAWGAARGEAWDAARRAAWDAALDAIAALVAWDDCAYLLDMEVSAVKVLAALGDKQAVLLLDAVITLNDHKGEQP